MEFDELKSSWKVNDGKTTRQEDIAVMLKENRHPVLKSIRKQLLLETTGLTLFLFFYYSMFDGDRKPLMTNLALVIAVLIPILHQVYGYFLHRNLILGEDLLDSLRVYIQKLKVYIIISLFSRLIFMLGLGIFFSYNIQFDNFRYYSALVILIVFSAQLFWLWRIWNKRLRQLEAAQQNFSAQT